MMPSTSVQIHSSAASSAAARMDAEKSEPPRPSVVGRPSAVAPLKPVTTGSTPCSSRGSRRARAFSRVGSISGEALPNTASVTTTSAGVDGGGGRAFGVQVFGDQQRREPLADGHGFIHRARRPLVRAWPCR